MTRKEIESKLKCIAEIRPYVRERLQIYFTYDSTEFYVMLNYKFTKPVRCYWVLGHKDGVERFASIPEVLGAIERISNEDIGS